MDFNLTPEQELQKVRILCQQQFQKGKFALNLGSRTQTGGIMGLMKQVLSDMENHNGVLSLLTGREITSSTLLTIWECSILSNALKDPNEEKWRVSPNGRSILEFAEEEYRINGTDSIGLDRVQQTTFTGSVIESGRDDQQYSPVPQTPIVDGTCYIDESGLPCL